MYTSSIFFLSRSIQANTNPLNDELSDYKAEFDRHERVNVPGDRDSLPNSLRDPYDFHRDTHFEKAAAERKELLRKLREEQRSDRRLSVALDTQLGMGRNVPKRTVPKDENDPLSQNRDSDPLLQNKPNVNLNAREELMEQRNSKRLPVSKDKMKLWEERKDPFADAKRRLLEKYMNPDPIAAPYKEGVQVDDAAKISEQQMEVAMAEEAEQPSARARLEQAKVRRGLEQRRDVRELEKYRRREGDRNFRLNDVRNKASMEPAARGVGLNQWQDTDEIKLSKKRPIPRKNQQPAPVAANREPSKGVVPSWVNHLSPNPNLGSFDVEAYLAPQRMLQGQGDPMKRFQFNQVASDSTPPDRYLRDFRDPRYVLRVYIGV